MKKIKLLPKIFLYTFAIMSFLIIISHLLIYFIFPITYLENRKDSIKNTADILAESIDGLDKSFINKYLELFSKNNEVKVFIKNDIIANVYKNILGNNFIFFILSLSYTLHFL